MKHIMFLLNKLQLRYVNLMMKGKCYSVSYQLSKRMLLNPAAKETGQARKPGTDTKQARLIAMLRQPDGATIDDVAKAFGWQPHTVRGALYGALKKKLDLNVTSEKVEGRGRVYRIAG
jgi:hypothetical protein